MDKGPLHAKLAHIEAETEKVTQTRVGLTETVGEQECARYYSIYILVQLFYKSLKIGLFYLPCQHFLYLYLLSFQPLLRIHPKIPHLCSSLCLNDTFLLGFEISAILLIFQT